MNLALRISLGFIFLVCGPSNLRASPITLNFSGIGTGTYNGTAFADALFAVVFAGEIPSMDVGSGGTGTGFSVPVSGTIAISGFNFAAMTATYPLSFNHPLPGWQLYINSDSGGIFYVGSLYLNSWNTTTPLVQVPFFLFGPGGAPAWSTNQGTVVFTGVSSSTFGDSLGVLNAVIIPEPSSLTLLGVGMLCTTLLGLARGKRS